MAVHDSPRSQRSQISDISDSVKYRLGLCFIDNSSRSMIRAQVLQPPVESATVVSTVETDAVTDSRETASGRVQPVARIQSKWLLHFA